MLPRGPFRYATRLTFFRWYIKGNLFYYLDSSFWLPPTTPRRQPTLHPERRIPWKSLIIFSTPRREESNEERGRPYRGFCYMGLKLYVIETVGPAHRERRPAPTSHLSRSHPFPPATRRDEMRRIWLLASVTWVERESPTSLYISYKPFSPVEPVVRKMVMITGSTDRYYYIRIL